jgi:hypothetical protein
LIAALGSAQQRGYAQENALHPPSALKRAPNRMAATGGLSGSVRGIDTNQRVEASVYVYTSTRAAFNDFVASVYVFEDGDYKFPDLEAGTYYVLAVPGDFGDAVRYRSTYYSGKTLLAQANAVSVLAGVTTTVDIATNLRSVVTGTPQAVAEAMGVQPSELISASFLGSGERGIGISGQPLGRFFPTRGSTFAILSTGNASSAEDADFGNTSTALDGLDNSGGWDMTRFALELRVPTTATCASFAFAFYSEEFPERVTGSFNDVFTAELGQTNLTISGNQVLAPRNFAFDSQNKSIAINTVFGAQSNTQTTYDGGTPQIFAQTPVTPSAISTFVFTIQDLGDSIYDSAVFMDDFSWGSDASPCKAGSYVVYANNFYLPLVRRGL